MRPLTPEILEIPYPSIPYRPEWSAGETVMSKRIHAQFCAIVLLALVALYPRIGAAQVQSCATSTSTFAENFTGTATCNQWYFFNGACLTAGTTTAANPGTGNGCTAIDSSYYSGEPLIGGANGTSGPTQTLPDPNGSGALRLTNGCTNEGNKGCGNATQVTGAATNTHTYGGGHHQNGAILSASTFSSANGVDITFKTVTYRGDSGGTGTDGADGMSFFLMDGSVSMSTYPNDFGAFGGSLGYTCTDESGNYDSTLRTDGTVRGFDGIVGGYMALGIDEYGNFLNQGDNTATGYNYVPLRIGLRGSGSISWKWLNTNYPSYYPSSLATTSDSTYTTAAGRAVHMACASGLVSDFSKSATNPASTTIAVSDYPALTNAYKVVSGLFTIANESAVLRGSTTIANTASNAANPITYHLKITETNLLSLSYSFNGGAYQPVITNQSLPSLNGNPPATYRFGFAGSTGGASNVHEIMCFKASPGQTASSSGGVNTYQNPTLKSGTQLYLATYSPSDWTGDVTAQALAFDTTLNAIVVLPTPVWDAACILNGVSSTTGACSTGVTSMAAEAPTSRVMLTWNGSAGIPFEWASLNTTEQGVIDQGDSTQNGNRVSFLRGDRTNEISTTGTCPQLTSSNLPCFRTRDSVLGDIVDSSPTWVGPPQTYDSTVTFNDLYQTSDRPSETSYATWATGTTQAGRLNVVYVGANDGFLHGFRAGSQDSNGNLVSNATTPNDGKEVFAYMPQAVFNTIHNNTQPELDYPNVQYAHNWYVDATPATGDVFYGGNWHTWVVGGTGAGGAAIYALDVTNPANFSETNAASLVIGEWGPSNITCTAQNISNCGANLGNTYGTPLIRRFHSGQWGIIFGNGYGASNANAAGIYIALLNTSTGAPTFYYLGTPALNGTTANGIASPASLDIDQDHIVDYIYAGDLQGHVWRFDVTSTTPTNWTLSGSVPLFTTPAAQPITAGLTVSTMKEIDLTSIGGQVIDNSKPERVIINFGTGQLIPQTLTAATQYSTATTQYIFGIWDANFNATGGWNTTGVPQAVAPSTKQTTVMTTVPFSSLVQQTITTVTQANPLLNYRTVSQNNVCWVIPSTVDATSGCASAGTAYGWYMILPTTMEQVIFSPTISPDGELVVNTFIPAQDSPLNCNTSDASTGFSMAVQPGDGWGSNGTSTGAEGFFQVSTGSGSVPADGVQLNGTGVAMFLSSGLSSNQNQQFMITQTSTGVGSSIATNTHKLVIGKRLNWIQRR